VPEPKEVEARGIHIGAVATYEDGYEELAYGNLIGRAWTTVLVDL
jgi:hypothetical protein